MIDRKTWYSGTPEQKEKNEYCLKLMEYEELVSEEYIKENLLYIDVKYERITTAMIISEAASMKDGELTLHRGR